MRALSLTLPHCFGNRLPVLCIG
ncbi:MAG: hypothetical protein RIT43_442, partial [Bacteroidota bacterium]